MITATQTARATAYLFNYFGRSVTCYEDGQCFYMATCADGSVYRRDVAYICNYLGKPTLVDTTGDSDELLIVLS